MLKDKIDSLIAEAMKEKNQVRLDTLRNIKTELLKFEKSEKGSTYNESVENDIILKMMTRSEDSIKQFKEGNRDDLAAQEMAQLDIIKEEEIAEIVKNAISDYITSKGEGFKISMRDTKPLMEIVKKNCPNVTGKHISEAIKAMI